MFLMFSARMSPQLEPLRGSPHREEDLFLGRLLGRSTGTGRITLPPTLLTDVDLKKGAAARCGVSDFLRPTLAR